MPLGTHIRHAGQALAELRLDPDDVVDVQLPAYRELKGSDPEEWQRVDRRRRLVSQMFGQARHKPQDGRPYEDWDDSWKQVGASGLPGDLTWEEFVASSGRYRRGITGARPRPRTTLRQLQHPRRQGHAVLLPQLEGGALHLLETNRTR